MRLVPVYGKEVTIAVDKLEELLVEQYNHLTGVWDKKPPHRVHNFEYIYGNCEGFIRCDPFVKQIQEELLRIKSTAIPVNYIVDKEISLTHPTT